MDTHGITEPNELERIRRINKENVDLQNIQDYIINRISTEWKYKKSCHGKIETKYYNFEYRIENCVNQTGNRTLTFLNSGKKIHDYFWVDIKNNIKYILSMY